MPPKSIQAKPKTKFHVGPWQAENTGERIIAYGSGGVGKSTLASLAPNPVFIPLSDGSKGVRKPNGEAIDRVSGIETFQDLRDALAEPSLWEPYDTIVLDDLSALEVLIEPYIFDNFSLPGKGAGKAGSIRDYGYDGMSHLVEVFRLFIADMDNLVYRNKHFFGIAHSQLVKIASAESFDYTEGGPNLPHNNQYSVRNTLFNWADHVVSIDFVDRIITKGKNDKLGKIEAGEDRAIFTQKSVQYLRKSRQLGSSGVSLPPEITFSDITNDSFWKFVAGATVTKENE